MARRALIYGVTGQDGSYLAELLLSKGYEVSGTMRRSSHPNLSRIEHIRDQIRLLWCDVTDAAGVMHVLRQVLPDEVYNLAAMSDVGISFAMPNYSAAVTGVGALNILEAIRQMNAVTIRFYQAGSSEMFGMNPVVPTSELSSFHPASPYASAKVFAHNSTVNYREAYGIPASNGILFNHESPRRGEGFVTRKITRGIADILAGRSREIVLGTIDTARDWGHARDYVNAMWLMLQQDEPSDYVVASGHAYTVGEFAERAFSAVGLDWKEFVRVEEIFARPLDPPVLLGNPAKAQRVLGWKPETSFRDLVDEMVAADCGERALA